MPKFKHTNVLRGGATAKYRQVESYRSNFFMVDHCNWGDKKGSKILQFNISIASAGGGTTDLAIQIGQDEFPAILELIAEEFPHTASIFSKCTSIAINSMRQEISELNEH